MAFESPTCCSFLTRIAEILRCVILLFYGRDQLVASRVKTRRGNSALGTVGQNGRCVSGVLQAMAG
jgi:hypothetical protein